MVTGCAVLRLQQLQIPVQTCGTAVYLWQMLLLHVFSRPLCPKAYASQSHWLKPMAVSAASHCICPACREAFADVYTGRAGVLAESIGKLRTKEVRKREAFTKGVQGLMPPWLLVGLGLDGQPPHCQISLTAPAAPSRLPHITLEDLKRVPLPGQDANQVCVPT